MKGCSFQKTSSRKCGVERKTMATTLPPMVTKKPITSKYLICILNLSCLLWTNIHNRLHRWIKPSDHIHTRYQVLPLHLIGIKNKQPFYGISMECTVDLLSEHTVFEEKLLRKPNLLKRNSATKNKKNSNVFLLKLLREPIGATHNTHISFLVKYYGNAVS